MNKREEGDSTEDLEWEVLSTCSCSSERAPVNEEDFCSVENLDGLHAYVDQCKKRPVSDPHVEQGVDGSAETLETQRRSDQQHKARGTSRSLPKQASESNSGSAVMSSVWPVLIWLVPASLVLLMAVQSKPRSGAASRQLPHISNTSDSSWRGSVRSSSGNGFHDGISMHPLPVTPA